MSEKLRKLITEGVQKRLAAKFRRRREADRAKEIRRRQETPGDELRLSEVEPELEPEPKEPS